MSVLHKRKHILPGFTLTLGVTLGWLGFLVVFPILVLMLRSASIAPEHIVKLLLRPAAVYSFAVTMKYALFTSCINCIVGFVIAWTMTRHKFWGHNFFDAIIDLPFALPGAVGGIALASVFGDNGFIGSFVGKFFDWLIPNNAITLVYNQFGILIGLMFVTLPFAVRSVQPLIKQLDVNEEHAALLLGAKPQHIFFKIQLPALIPGIVSAFVLTFARSIGEYGTVIFVAGNIPLKSEVISRYIYNKIDQYDLDGAMVVASVLMLISFIILVTINVLQSSLWHKFTTKTRA